MSGPPRETPKIDRTRRRARTQQWVAKPQVGDQLGSFRLLQLLGEGGAGAVYRAEHTFLKRPVAIKILHPELYLRPAMVARFFQEALAVNRARHRNIIDITDVVASEKYPPFIVMELLEGEDLGDYIDKYAPVPLSLTVALAKQICAALAVVHALDIVHRDLKPENIFLVNVEPDIDGEVESTVPTVKLLDFGIAKFIDNEENRRRTWSGNILGTPAYMPLEQLHGLPVDHRADIYALGVVLYEMLSGRLPFELERIEDLADHPLSLTPAAPSSRTIRPPVQPIPPAVDEVVLRCLSDDPSKRFQTVRDLSHALEDAARAPVTATAVVEASAPLPAAPADEAEEAQRRRNVSTEPDLAAIPRIPTDQGSDAPRSSRRAPLYAAAALIALGLVGWGGYALWRADRRTPTRTASSAPTRSTAPTPRPGAIIQLTSVPPHARIHRADTGALVGQTPTSIPVSAATPQELILRMRGFRDARVTLRQGGPNPVQIWLEPELAPRRAEPPRDAGAPRTEPPRRIRVVRVTPRRRPPPREAPRPMVTDLGIVDPFPMRPHNE